MLPPWWLMARVGYSISEMQDAEDQYNDSGPDHLLRQCLQEYHCLMRYGADLKRMYGAVVADAVSKHGIHYPSPPEGFIFSIQARLESLGFFEAGNSPPPITKRSYAARFQKQRTRFIWLEYRLRHIPPGGQIDYSGVCDWYQAGASGNTKIHTSQFSFHILPEWEYSNFTEGCGWAEVGQWTPGNYSVILYLQGEFVATRSFEIC